ncbi:MAG: GPI inositol deacylase [Vezdaea aestivalis]|nr:MAG: GPI inositol deacylase [Vezdaea aestivalis]
MRRRPSSSAADDDDPDDTNTTLPDPAPAPTQRSLDRLKSAKSSSAWKSSSIPSDSNGSPDKELDGLIPLPSHDVPPDPAMPDSRLYRRARMRSPWSCSLLTLSATVVAACLLFATLHSLTSSQLDRKGCRMSYMRPAFAKFDDFDTEHTRFASKYSLYLYREQMVDEDTKVKGVPVLFIPGNAGSYKQVRPIAAEAATYFQDKVQQDVNAIRNGTRSLDFFTVDFNEDITAFHGQTLLDQAEYLNEAVAFVLSLYHDPRRSQRDPELPDPTSVIILGHSMGGIVARTMLTMHNYQSNSINTIITMSAPHARPPVSFDADIVRTYNQINTYWREAYSQKWANNNPLWHVTLISIAGGSLDTVVPSDYASLASLVPETNGFTVFTSSIPNVWTGMDHQAILWCDQFRKVLVRALTDVVNVHRPAQTKSRADRMRAFKKWFLTGMESVAEKTLPQSEPTTLLTLEDNSNSIIQQGKRLTLTSFGQLHKPQAYLLPVPPYSSPSEIKFTLLSDQQLDSSGQHAENLEVLLCSVFPLEVGQTATLFSMNMDLSGNSSGSTRLACKNAAADSISLPASTRASKYPFDEAAPFSYLQYDLDTISKHQFVAVVDKSTEARRGWAVAEFSDRTESVIQTNVGLHELLRSGVHLTLTADRPMTVDIKVPALQSSLLTYNLRVGNQACEDGTELFTPFVRQYISEPYESKYFVNVKHASINLHGVAPFMPPPLKGQPAQNGVSLQLWTDPTCSSSLEVSLEVDFAGSLGKLYMRYRTIFAAFPILVVALVIRKQFKAYDEVGIFISFSESMDLTLRRSLPLLFLALSLLAVSFARSSSAPPKPSSSGILFWRHNATESAIDYTKNDLLLGSQDPFFWFLVPMLGMVSVGICVALNYTTLVVTHLFSYVFTLPPFFRSQSSHRHTSQGFATTSPRRRFLTTLLLLFLVATLIPYQFAYLVTLLVQLSTCARAVRTARDSRSAQHANFANYAHSLLLLMLWILPINLPVLVVWIHNLSVHWLTPFSSHHNVLSIMPFILLVEMLTAGRMVPRLGGGLRYVTSTALFAFAVYAAIYGVTYAYVLHHLANAFVAWLVAIHFSEVGVSWRSLGQLLDVEGSVGDGREEKKTP